MAEINPPTFIAGGCYTAQDHRRLWGTVICSEGVRVAGGVGTDLRVGANTANAMTVNIAEGEAYIQGDDIAGQGFYHVVNDATTSLTLADAGPTDTRIDLIVARVTDPQYVAGGVGWELAVIPGQASPNPQVPDLPNSAIPLASVTVAPGTTMLQPGMIDDLRSPWAYCSDVGRVIYSGQDLNDFVSPGVFFPQTDSAASGVANWPVHRTPNSRYAGLLEVFAKPEVNEVIQRVTEFARNDYVIWERHLTGGNPVWGSWLNIGGPGRWVSSAFAPDSTVTGYGPSGGGDGNQGGRLFNGGVDLSFQFTLTGEHTTNAFANFSPDIVLGTLVPEFHPRANTDVMLIESGAQTVFGRIDGAGSGFPGRLSMTHGNYPNQTVREGTTLRISVWYPSWVERT